MKAILEFNLPDEDLEHRQAVLAKDAWYVIHDLDMELRSLVKHGAGPDRFKSVEELADYIRREHLSEIIAKLGD